MAYFMIFVRDDSQWLPQFGDADRECVEQEREDQYLGQRGMRYEDDGKYAAKDIKIVKFARCPSQEQVDEMTAKLNA